MNKREKALDIIRVISALLVVAVHVYTTPFHTAMAEHKATGIMTGAYIFYKIFRAIGELAIPIFLMLSGAFVFASDKTADYKNFNRKTWKKLCIPTIVFTVIYYVEGCFRLVISGLVERGDIKTMFLYETVSTLYGQPESHMWYMYTFIGLNLLAPCIVIYKIAVGDNTFKKSIWILWIWGTISNILVPTEYYWSLGFVVNMLGLFMLGYVAHEWGKSKKGTKAGWLMLLAGIVIITIFALMTVYLSDVAKLIGGTSPFSPMVGIAGFFIVAAFSSFDSNIELGIIPASTFWVYLCHPLIMLIVFEIESKILNIPYNEIGAEDKWIIPNISLVIIVILSFAVGIIIERIVNAKLYRKKIAD